MSGEVTPAQLRAMASLKWTQFEPDVLAAWVAEMDFGLADTIARALHDAVDRGQTGYHSPDASRSVAEAATGFWGSALGWEVSPDWVFDAPDVIEGIRRAIVHLTPPDSPVILHTPVYFPFFSMVERAGRDLLEVPSTKLEDGSYQLDLDGIESGFRAGAGSIVVCNPWNPTGMCLGRGELGPIVELASRYGARVIADEVHAPLTYQGVEHLPAATLEPEVVVTVTSASKAWNLPGLKCAQVVLSKEDDRRVWSEYFTPDKIGVGTFGLIANTAAYASGGGWLEEVKLRVESNRRVLQKVMRESLPGVGFRPPDGTYLAWLDFTAHGIESPAAYFLEHARVAMTEGAPFGSGGQGHARLNFATEEAILVEVVERIAAALDR